MSGVPVVTVDGPSGTGKGTIAGMLAKTLGFNLLDSGAIYRALALAARQMDLSGDRESELAALGTRLNLEFRPGAPGAEPRVLLDGVDVATELRAEKTGELASRVAVLAGVREALLERQRAFVQPPGLVADGRDMGTVVFPRASVKLFLTAAPDERARRRHKQLMEKGISVSLPALVRDITERDLRDSTRVVAPLKPAEDAVTLDTTGLSIAATYRRALDIVTDSLA